MGAQGDNLMGSGAVGAHERGNRVKRDQSERGVRALFHIWRSESRASIKPDSDQSFDAFHSWLWQNYRQVLNFDPVMRLVRDDVKIWFDDEFNQHPTL